MASKGSEVIKSIHALAALRHLDADASQIGVVVKPLRADCSPTGPVGAGGPPSVPMSLDEELAERCQWEAQVRLGGGKWGCFVGTGETPGRALLSLLKFYEESHEAVDKRRAGVLERRREAVAAEGGTPPEGAGPPPAQDSDGVRSFVGRLEPTPEQKSFMSGYTAGAQSMGGLLDGVAAERAYHAQVALLDDLIAQLGTAASLKEAQLAVREARLNLPLPHKK